jgi:hypothetical protein
MRALAEVSRNAFKSFTDIGKSVSLPKGTTLMGILSKHMEGYLFQSNKPILGTFWSIMQFVKCSRCVMSVLLGTISEYSDIVYFFKIYLPFHFSNGKTLLMQYQ